MATIEQRLQALESKHAINDNAATDIILVSFAGKDELYSPINHIWFEDFNFYMTEGESEEDFQNRASAEIRKTKKDNPNCIHLLFGDRVTNG